LKTRKISTVDRYSNGLSCFLTILILLLKKRVF
jgi:hypothetical protein